MKTETVVPTFFGNPNVLTPSEVRACADHQHIEDMYPDGMGDVARFHVDRVLGWFVEERNDGRFWTVSGNRDVLVATLEEAVAFLASEGGAAEFAYALERAGV
jgi:hypothetical protein